jgi:GNAT superfamily N-acetyltransferase
MIEARGGAGGRFAIVGTVILDAGQTPERVKIARIVTIELSKSARGRNIGSQVIEALSASARAYGARRLETRIPADNPRLDAFCSRLGFRPAQMADQTATEGSHDVNGYRAIVRELKQS